MISLKIKTLDSQDHDFTVEDDITVRQFKEHIAIKTSVAADMQRLIYCGRVLNDEKPLNEYNVNGKVVHLVERAPPRTRAATDSRPEFNSTFGGGGGGGGRNDGHDLRDRRAPSLFRSIDSMVAMAIPMNTNTGTTQAITHTMNPSSTLCMNRITVARHMLDCANNIVNYLESPERGLNNSELDILAQQTMESTVFEVGISAVSDGDVPPQDVQNFVQAFQGAVSAAFRHNGLTNIEISPPSESGVRMPTFTIGGRPSTVIIGTEPQQQPEIIASAQSITTRSIPTAPTAEPATNAGSTSTSASGTASAGSSASETTSATSSPSRNQTTSTTVLAEVVQQMRTVQTRIEPFLQQYYDILQNEPSFAENETAARESSQRIFDRMSEALHYMSHAQHAISDLMLDLSQTTPRHLCCRPILVEQSAYVSSGFAVPQGLIQYPRRMDANAGANNNESAATNNNTAASALIADGIAQIQGQLATAAAAAVAAQANAPENAPSDQPTANGTANVAIANTANRQMNVARLIQAVVNAVPMYADVHVEIAPRPSEQAPSLTPASDAAVSATATPSVDTAAAAATATSTNATPSNDSTPTSAGATSTNPTVETRGNDQPRVTTATHPTTSTQTRSTARPQVHMTTLPPGMRNFRPGPPPIQLSSFDRFLPCNSHHVRENQERGRQPHIHMHRRNPIRRATVNLAPRSQSIPRTFRTPDDLAILSQEEHNIPIRIFGCSFPIRDLVHIAPHPSTLNRVRSELDAYAGQVFGRPYSADQMRQLSENVYNILSQSILAEIRGNHSSYDVITSVSNLLLHTLRTIVTLILEDDSNDFGMRLLRAGIEFVRRLMVLLVLCVGRFNAQTFIYQMIDLGITTTNPSEETAYAAFRRHVRVAALRQFDSQIIDRSEVQQFLVIRLPVPETAPLQEVIPMDTDEEATTALDPNAIANYITPMCTALQEEFLRQTPCTPLQTTIPVPPQLSADDEPLPSVMAGSENWHNGLPTEWLPVITRDINRQRRNSAQTAVYSDAYLSGMTSKRRKLIASAKPSGSDPRSILTDSVRQVIQTRNVAGSSAASSNISADEALAANSHIHEPYGSYEQAIRTAVQSRISSDPDYTPERFPNCSKWINKKK